MGAKKLKYYLYNDVSGEFMRVHDGTICGRTEGELQFPQDKLISRKHCRFKIAGNEIYLEDLGATNRTCVNTVPVRPERKRRLLLNDLIQVGSQRLILTHQTLRPPAHVQDASPSQFYLALRRADGSLTRFFTRMITRQTLIRVNKKQFQRLKSKGFWRTYGVHVLVLIFVAAFATAAAVLEMPADLIR